MVAVVVVLVVGMSRLLPYMVALMACLIPLALVLVALVLALVRVLVAMMASTTMNLLATTTVMLLLITVLVADTVGQAMRMSTTLTLARGPVVRADLPRSMVSSYPLVAANTAAPAPAAAAVIMRAVTA